MSRREYYLSALLLSLAALPAVAQQQEAERPNIVVIVADDMGTNEIGCYGGQNLADCPEHAGRIATMREALEAWMQQQGNRGKLMDTQNPDGQM